MNRIMGKKRISHFLRAFVPPTESFIYNQISSIEEFDVINYCNHKIPGSNYSKIEALEISKLLPFYEKFVFKLSYLLFRFLPSFASKRLVREIKSQNVQLLHFHYLIDARYFLKIVKLLDLPSVVSGYGWDVSLFPKKYFGLGKYYLKPIFKYMDIFLAMSDDMKNDLLRLGCPNEKIIVHYHGIDVKRFLNPNRNYNNKSKYNILFCGRLVPKKSPQSILYALKVLENDKDMFPDWHLTFVGDGPLRKQLYNIVHEYNWHKKVTFTGHIKHTSNELIKFYHNADIYIQPSVTANGEKEGIPGTLIEAMSAGLPVISTKHAGIPYIISHEINGLLIDEGDVLSLAKHLKRLLLSRELREKLGKNAAIKAKDELDLKQKTKELEEIYKSILR